MAVQPVFEESSQFLTRVHINPLMISVETVQVKVQLYNTIQFIPFCYAASRASAPEELGLFVSLRALSFSLRRSLAVSLSHSLGGMAAKGCLH